MKTQYLWVVIAIVAIVLGGCASATSETEVLSDGTWNRKLELTVQKGMDENPDVYKVFVKPTGQGWTFAEKKTESEVTVTASRKAKIGDPAATDIQIKNKAAIVFKNSVQIREISPGRFEYSETYTSLRDAKGPSELKSKEAFKDLKSVLPASVPDAKIEKIVQGTLKHFVKVLFGPGDPMILQLITNQKYVERKLRSRLVQALDKVIAEELADSITEAERKTAVRKLLQKMDAQEMVKKPDPNTPPSEGDESGLTGITAIVKLPGKIIETDGEVDPVTGEVFWALYPEAAQLGPVTIRAVCDVNP